MLRDMKFTLVLLSAGLLGGAAFAQIPGLKGPKIDLGTDALFNKGPAITTNLKDAKWEVTDKDDSTRPPSP